MKKIYLSKLDAAKRQLETAIELFFHFGDCVSIHGLASASREILETLLKKQGRKTFTDMTMDYIRPGKRSFVKRRLDKTKNFIKHADRDEKDILEFNPESSEFVLMFASHSYRELVGDAPLLISCYISWFALKYPHLILKTDDQKTAKEMRKIIDPEERIKYLNQYSEAYYKLRKTSKTTKGV